MKLLTAVLFTFTCISSVQAAGRFQCDNAPAKGWKTYYCVAGSYHGRGVLTEVEYGTCNGSDDAGESEPSEIVEMAPLKPNPSLRSASHEWNDAYAYNVGTREHGHAVLYLQSADMRAKGDGVGRLKLVNGDRTKNVLLRCYYN